MFKSEIRVSPLEAVLIKIIEIRLNHFTKLQFRELQRLGHKMSQYRPLFNL